MNFYDVLGVAPEASPEEVRRAFRERARRYHPDVNDHPKAAQQFKVLTTARDVLVDDEERAAYDRLGHDAYVGKRLDKPLPGVEMAAEPGEDSADRFEPDDSAGSGGLGAVADEGTDSDGSAAVDTTSGFDDGGRSGGRSSTSSYGADVGFGSSDDAGGEGAGATGGSAGSAADPSTVGPGAGPSEDDPATDPPTGGAGTDSPPGTAGAEGAGGSFDAATAGAETGGTSESSAGSDGSPGGTPPGAVAGAAAATDRTADGATVDQGPDAARERRQVREDAAGHFSASYRWLGVVAAAAVYATGLAGYLRANAETLFEAWAALVAFDFLGAVAALRAGRPAGAYLFSFARSEPWTTGYVPSEGALFVSGIVVLPLAVLVAVLGLRRKTNWQPTWLYVPCALAPAAAVGFQYAVGRGLLPVSAAPLWADLVLLVVLPAVGLAAFLLNRVVLVLPLRRRADLVDPSSGP